jgi:hypothetical protein
MSLCRHSGIWAFCSDREASKVQLAAERTAVPVVPSRIIKVLVSLAAGLDDSPALPSPPCAPAL